jgi:pseudomonalisin
MRKLQFFVSLFALLWLSVLEAIPASGQSGLAVADAALSRVAPQDRVLAPVDDGRRVALRGNTTPEVSAVHDTGSVQRDRILARVLMVLKPDAAQQQALDNLVEAQQDPESPLYHHWLTPATYAKHFGVSDGDIEQVRNWLERYGLEVEPTSADHRTLVFSGSAAQIESAFQTRMRTYTVAGRAHIANDSDPTIPRALAGVVGGVVSLHDFFSAPQHEARRIAPEFTAGGAHYLSPADFATIYDVSSLYHQAYDGSGETIAIVGRSDISVPDIRVFRSQFGLIAKDPKIIVNGRDPGSSVTGDLDEAMLDVEWSGAVANRATIDYVTTASTATSDGVFLSAQYVVNHNLAPILSVSYGLCESSLGASGSSFFNSLWQQATAQGITVLVSAGDSGAAGCDAASQPKATQGRGVNGLCSTPYSTCVGGTGFNDTSNPALYWSNANSASGASVLSYVPELAWNESGAGGLWASGGGPSAIYPKPSWQIGLGVPVDGKRDVPDVSLTAAAHDAYVVQVNGAMYGFSGTSAASPSFAGLLALVAQKQATRLGNANPALYKLAAAQHTAGTTAPAVFHDVLSGNNSVPGVAGYSAGSGYDMVTGLGSIDAEKLVTAWGAPSAPKAVPTFTFNIVSPAIALTKGGTATVTATTATSGGFSAPVLLTISGLPAGLTASVTAGTTISTPGAGSRVIKFTAGPTLAPGAWTPIVTASGGGITRTVSLTGSMAGLSVSATPASTKMARGSTLVVTVQTAALGGFHSAVNLKVSGLPSGITAKSTVALPAPGTGRTTITLTATKTAVQGAAKAQVTASGAGLSQTTTLVFTVH